ncbi:MAG TPA: hypothetical protein VFP50_18260 [Anaeromyxobacteraceae bacterium]|nr:hypothetical protein [Anaeromyxobacteraceae bacterium]
MAQMAKAQRQQQNLEPEITAYAIRREGPNFRIVTVLFQGDRVIASTESDADARSAQVSRIMMAFQRVP